MAKGCGIIEAAHRRALFIKRKKKIIRGLKNSIK